VLRAYDWDGHELTQRFEVDFNALKLGRAHHMKFSARPAGKQLADLAAPKVAQR
jgi:selenium-binding protein 1